MASAWTYKCTCNNRTSDKDMILINKYRLVDTSALIWLVDCNIHHNSITSHVLCKYSNGKRASSANIRVDETIFVFTTTILMQEKLEICHLKSLSMLY